MRYLFAVKFRISKAFLAQLPAPVAEQVRTWAEMRRVNSICVEYRSRFFVAEDANYTAFSPDCGTQKSARAAGEWSGPTGLRPGAECPIPTGCTVIETGIFCGRHFLNIFNNNAAPVLSVIASAIPQIGARA